MSAFQCFQEMYRCDPASLLLPFRKRLERMKANLEMLSQHAVHVDKNAHDFRNIRLRTAHSPRYPCHITYPFQCEFVDVVGFKWLCKIDPHRDLERSR